MEGNCCPKTPIERASSEGMFFGVPVLCGSTTWYSLFSGKPHISAGFLHWPPTRPFTSSTHSCQDGFYPKTATSVSDIQYKVYIPVPGFKGGGTRLQVCRQQVSGLARRCRETPLIVCFVGNPENSPPAPRLKDTEWVKSGSTVLSCSACFRVLVVWVFLVAK